MGGGTMQYEKDIEAGKICETCERHKQVMDEAGKFAQIEIKTQELAILKEEVSDRNWTNGYIAGMRQVLNWFT